MTAIRTQLRALARDQRGATAVEYGLIVTLIAVAAIGGMQAVGGGATGLWGKIETKVVAALS